MNKPTRPNKPKEPKPLNTELHSVGYNGMSLEELIKELPEDIDFKSVTLEAERDCCCYESYCTCGPKFNAEYKVSIKNKNYDKQLKAYKEKLKDYKVKLKIYNEKLQIWQEEENNQELDRLKKEVARLTRKVS